MAKLDAKSIIDYIGNAPKKTPVKVFIKGDLAQIVSPKDIDNFTEAHCGVIFGDWKDIERFLKENHRITADHIENDARNSAFPLLDFKKVNARIEPGSIIRDQVV